METSLQIVISLIDQAEDQLTEVRDQLASLATTADEASAQITSSLTEAEQAAADAAIAAAQQWEGSGDAIAAAADTAASSADSAFMSISDASLAAANDSSEGWQNSLAELQEMMAQATDAAETDFAEIGDAATASASRAGGSFGYFHNLILGMLAERTGGGITSALQDVISTTSGVPEQIAQLTAQINQQKASIVENEAALVRWNGTTVQVQAEHQKAAADIEAERVKIAELTRELQPLEAAQQAAGASAQDYNAALLQLNTDWQALLATIGGPFVAAATNQILYIDQIVESMQQWAAAHPELAKEILTFMAVLGPALTMLGELAIGWAIVSLALTSTVGPFLLVGAAIAVVIAAVIALWPQIQQLFDYLNQKYGVINVLRAAWEQLSSEFSQHLLPDLEKLWSDLQPIMPYLEEFAGVVGGVLLTAILALADGLLRVADAFAQMLDYATQVADFLTTHLQPILNSIRTLVQQFSGSSGASVVGGASSSIMSTVGSAILSTIPGLNVLASVHDAIITPSGIIQTDPADYLIATKTPGALAGVGKGGGGITININYPTLLNQANIQQVTEAIMTSLNRQQKLVNFF